MMAAVTGELDRLVRDLRKSFSRAQRKAEERLGRVGDEAVEPVAEVLFSESADPYTRGCAFSVLERIGTAPVIPHMLRAVREDGSHAYTAARFLARRKDPAVLASLRSRCHRSASVIAPSPYSR